MENKELLMETLNNEVVEETMENVVEEAKKGKGLLVGAVIGVAAVAGVAVYKKVIKPRIEAKKLEQAETNEGLDPELMEDLKKPVKEI